MNLKSALSPIIISLLYINIGFASENDKQESKKPATDTTKQLKDDAASGLPTGKRDAASGLPSGKRHHKPVSVTKPIDKSTPSMKKPINSSNLKAGYRLCPDGTKINPGEKCPEKKSKSNKKLCPDGSKIKPSEKCPK